MGFPDGTVLKSPYTNAGDTGLIPRLGRSPEKEMATYSRILTWEILWSEEPGGPQSMGLQRVGHDLVTEQEEIT